MKTHIFIQARQGSKRFPKKILKKILGKSILEIIKERLELIENVDEIYLVTGNSIKNRSLIDEGKKLNLKIFEGSETNILDRFYHASTKFQSDNIIRVTGDNPLLEPTFINYGLNKFLENDVDILSNNRKLTFPKGLNFEIFKKSSLDISWYNQMNKFKDKSNFLNEFFTPVNELLYGHFKNFDYVLNKNYSSLRLTMDYETDYDFIKKLFEIIYPNNKTFTFYDILDCIKENPKLLSINNSDFSYDNLI